jgi:hypothetical protein
MRRLSKRWEPFRGIYGNSLYRSFLSEIDRTDHSLSWACIEFTDPKGPFRLEIWDGADDEWVEIDRFPTLKKAKEVGRLLAGIALAKNI